MLLNFSRKHAFHWWVSCRCRLNGLVFDRLERSVVEERDSVRQVYLAKIAALFARRSGCGRFASEKIERVFLARAESLKVDLPASYEPGTVLMVMSEAYCFGGHTQVVERWVRVERRHRYSLVTTRQNRSDVPDSLASAVAESGGGIHCISPDAAPNEAALQLRRLSARFESVVLFVHPDDIIPLLAYGTDDFRRPVGLYNHMDHAFWFGAALVDGMAEIRAWGRSLSCRRRGLERIDSTVLAIPGGIHRECSAYDRRKGRSRLGLSDDVKLVITAGGSYKYKPIGTVSFLQVAEPLLERIPGLVIVAIGVDPDGFPDWRRVSAKFGGRLMLKGKMPHAELMEVLLAADLFVGSRPVPGFTTVSDAIECGLPVLFDSTPAGLMDWMIGCAACCGSASEIVEKALRIVNDRDVAGAHRQETSAKFSSSAGSAAFVARADGFLCRLLERGHAVHGLSATERSIGEFDVFLSRLGGFDLRDFEDGVMRGLYGKWGWPRLVLRAEREPLKAVWFLLRWLLKGCP